MAAEKLRCAPKISVNTGNILGTDLSSTTNEYLRWKLQNVLHKEGPNAGIDVVSTSSGRMLVQVAPEELRTLLPKTERDDLRLNVKLFLNKFTVDCVEEAVTAVVEAFGGEKINSLVLAYHPKADEANNGLVEPPLKPPCGEIKAEGTPKSMTCWRAFNGEQHFEELRQLYRQLERHHGKEVHELGLADMDATTLADLLADARIRPHIAQLSVDTCCVVPPPLQALCAQHKIQLLTHGDAKALLTEAQFSELLPSHKLDWTLRYNVYVISRSLLTAKGYIIGGSAIAT